jgi:hypothetical protein
MEYLSRNTTQRQCHVTSTFQVDDDHVTVIGTNPQPLARGVERLHAAQHKRQIHTRLNPKLTYENSSNHRNEWGQNGRNGKRGARPLPTCPFAVTAEMGLDVPSLRLCACCSNERQYVKRPL